MLVTFKVKGLKREILKPLHGGPFLVLTFAHSRSDYHSHLNFEFGVYVIVYLQDVEAHTSKPCGKHSMVLSLISYIGCGLSILGLSLTIFTFAFFR